MTVASVAFNGGEVSDLMDGRPDQARVKSGCKLLRNTICLAQGPATRRSGLFHINQSAAEVGRSVRLVPFNFSTIESRVLEFYDEEYDPVGDPEEYRGRMRIIKDDAYVQVDGPPDAWVVSTEYNAGETVLEDSRHFCAKVAHTSDATVTKPIVGSAWKDSWVELPIVSSTTEYMIWVPYLSDDLDEVWYKQSRDVVYIASPSYAPAKIGRYADDNWRFEYIEFIPDTEIPTGIGITGSVGDPTPSQRNYRYLITAIDDDDGEESLVSEEASITTSVLNSLAQNYNTLWWWENDVAPLEYRIYKYETGSFGYIGSTPHKANLFALRTGPSGYPTTTFEDIVLTNGHTYNLMVEGTGSVTAGSLRGTPYGSAAEGTALTFVADATQSERFQVNGTITRWQLTDALIFDDDNIAPDLEDTPPEGNDPFTSAGNYPSIVFFWSQRLGWAATDNEPFTHWLSPKGLFENLSASIPPQPEDAITATLAVDQANRVQWVEGDRVLLSGTSENEWSLGKADEALIPANADFYRQENVGSERIPPLLIGSNILFVQRGGSVIQEISYTFTNDRYKAKEISIIASHLLDGKSVVKWCYQKRPYSVVWMVLSDATLVGMTYMPEHEVIGWHRHDSENSWFMDVCCSNGDDQDIVTFSILRLVDGSLKRYNERFDAYFIREADPADAFFVDSGVKYNIYDATDGLTLLLDDVTGDIEANCLEERFKASDVGHTIREVNSIGAVVGELEITAIINGGYGVEGTVTTEFSSTSLDGGTWGLYAVELVDIAYHLRGETVKIWADAAEQEEKVVGATGTVTLDLPAENIHLGLQMISDIIPTRPELSSAQETTLARKYKISQAVLRVYKSMGVKVGKNEDQLAEIITHDAYDPRQPQLVTGDRDVSSDTGWDEDWEFLIRADGPAPMTLSAIIYDVEVAEEI